MPLQATSLGREPRPREIERLRRTLSETLAGLIDVSRRALQREDASRQSRPACKASDDNRNQDDDILDEMAVW